MRSIAALSDSEEGRKQIRATPFLIKQVCQYLVSTDPEIARQAVLVIRNFSILGQVAPVVTVDENAIKGLSELLFSKDLETVTYALTAVRNLSASERWSQHASRYPRILAGLDSLILSQNQQTAISATLALGNLSCSLEGRKYILTHEAAMGKICTLFSSSQEPETVRCLTRAIGNFGHSEQGCNYILSHAAAMEKVCELLSSRQERDISEDVVKVLENIESGARKQMGDIKNAKTSVTAPQGYGHLPSDKAPCLISATALAILANHATCQKGDLKVQSACEQLIKLYLVRYCFDENYKPVLTDLSQSTTWSKNGGRQLASTALATL